MNKVLTYYSKIKNHEINELQPLLDALPERVREKNLKLNNINNANASLSAFNLLEKALKLNNINIYEYNYSIGKYGKPYLEGCPFKFSISHSKELCVVSISLNEVGTDVEMIKPRSLKIDRLFTKKEKDYVEGSKNCLVFFYEIWTGKEAYLKENGRGLSTPLDSFEILDTSRKNLVHFMINDTYMLSVYSSKPSEFETPIEIKI